MGSSFAAPPLSGGWVGASVCYHYDAKGNQRLEPMHRIYLCAVICVVCVVGGCVVMHSRPSDNTNIATENIAIPVQRTAEKEVSSVQKTDGQIVTSIGGVTKLLVTSYECEELVEGSLVAFFKDENRWPDSFDELKTWLIKSGRTYAFLDICTDLTIKANAFGNSVGVTYKIHGVNFSADVQSHFLQSRCAIIRNRVGRHEEVG